MIPQHWPSFWLGLLAWPLATFTLIITLTLLWELSGQLDKLEHHIKQRLATRKGTRP